MKKDTNNLKDKTKCDGPEKPDSYMGNDKQWVFRALVLAFVDMCIIAISFFFALMIRFEFSYSHIPLSFLEGYLHIVPLFMVISLVVFYIFRLYHSIWRFASINEFMHIIGAFLVLTVLCVIIHEVYEIKMPYAFWIIGLMLSFALCTACRFAYRFIRTGQKMLEQRGFANGDERVMIIGAGNAGRMLIRELIMSSHLHTKACCIIDDNPAKLGRFIDGVPIVGNRNDIPEMVEKYDITKIVYAVPSTSGKDRKDILNICKDTGCDVSVVPGIYQMVDGRVSVSNLRPVSIEDLLGRDPVVVDNDGNIVGNDQNTIIMEDKHIEKGKLILTKTVEGNISKENAKKITFKVMNQETKKTDKYTLDEFSYDEASKTWTKELDVLAEEYTVEETNSSVEGYTVKTTYKIDTQEIEGKKTESIQIENQGEVTVAFKNSYTPKPYEVAISKQDLTNEKEIAGATLKIVNQKTKEEVAPWVSEKDKTHTVSLPFGEYILIEEVVPDGYKKADDIYFKVSKKKNLPRRLKKVERRTAAATVVNTYSLKDFNYDESNKKWTKELIQVAGGYKVEELVTSIKGHKLSLTQYQRNENGEIKEKVTDKIAEKVTVKKDKTTFIEFENNYDLNVFDVEIDKTDISGTKEVDGAKLKVIDEEGNLVERWISGQDDRD